MAWTTPETYTAGLLMTATKMNLISANLNALKAPASGKVTLTGNVSTTSTSLIDLTGATTGAFTTAGGALIVGFSATLSVAIGPVDESADIIIDIDGATVFQQRVRLTSTGSVADWKPVAMTFASGALSAGSHTVKIRWKSVGGAQVTLAAATAPAQLFAVEAWF